MQLAINSVKNEELSLRQAAKNYGVPLSTLSDRCSTRGGKIGRPTVLSEEEEDMVVERIILMGDWGFPLTKVDLKKIIREYLVATDRVTRFTDNHPGPDFTRGFLRRHGRSIAVRKSSNLKRSKASVTAKIVDDFFARRIPAQMFFLESSIF